MVTLTSQQKTLDFFITICRASAFQYLCCCHVSAAIDILIVKFLDSCVVNEGEDVHFQCQLSHAETPQIQWKLNGVPLQNNEMNLIKSEGRVHSLTLRGVTAVDSGTVTFTVGNHTSTASLTVRGKRGGGRFKPFKATFSYGLFSLFLQLYSFGDIVDILILNFSKLIVIFFL